MNEQTQITPTQNDLQGQTNPQTVRQDNTIQSGALSDNSATNTLYINPSNVSISVPGVGLVSPTQSSNQTNYQSQKVKNSNNQMFVAGLLVAIIVFVLIFLIAIDRVKTKKFI